MYSYYFFFFFFNDTATTEIYTLSLQTLFRSQGEPRPLRGEAERAGAEREGPVVRRAGGGRTNRSEEHTSELQSPYDLVCRLLLEKKKKKKRNIIKRTKQRKDNNIKTQRQ